MKKVSKNSVIAYRVAGILPLALIAIYGGWLITEQQPAVTGMNTLLQTASRHVENVKCSGVCENVLLVSSNEPDAQYFPDNTLDTCSEAILWANKNGREDQIVFGGYQIVNGYQENLRTQTFGLDVLDGIDVDFTLPDTGSSFIAKVKDTGEWNLLESAVCNEMGCQYAGTTRIFTDRDSGRVSLYDTCTKETGIVSTYTLYQAPNVQGPSDDLTYSVGIGKIESFGAGSGEGFIGIFDREYASSELVENSIHITANAGGTTFDFDLVKDAK